VCAPVSRQAKNRGGDIGAVLRGCNTITRVPAINHAEVVGSNGGGGSCADAARARAREGPGDDDNNYMSTERQYEREMRKRQMEREMEYDRHRKMERENEAIKSQMETKREEEKNGRPQQQTRKIITDTTVAIGLAIVVDETGASIAAAPSLEYATARIPPYATSRSGSGSGYVEDGVLGVYSAFRNLGESMNTAAFIWAERLVKQNIEQRRRGQAQQAVFMQRMAGLMLVASDDMVAASGGTLEVKVTAQAGRGPGSIGSARGHNSSSAPVETSAKPAVAATSSLALWPLWRWDGLFAPPPST